MLKNYFKFALRNIRKNKITTFINLFGLSIGMTAAVFIFLWVQNEMSFNSFYPGAKNIYRVTNTIQINNTDASVWDGAPLLMGETVQKEIPEVQQVGRVMFNPWDVPVLTINHRLFSDKETAWIDTSWFNVFHYDFVMGNAANFGKDPFTVVLTESKAKKYFGNTNPIGQIIKVDTVNYSVEGIIKNNPVNSSFQFGVLLNINGQLSDPKVFENYKSWNNFSYVTFLRLRPDANKQLVEIKLNKIINNNRTNNNAKVTIRPLSDIYFESDLRESEMPHGNKQVTYIFSLLGLLLLITACINYVNLTTAKSSLRAREVSVKKIVGAKIRQLFFQFIIESLTVSALAMFITLLLVQLFLPGFNAITEKQFTLPLSSFRMWQIVSGILLFTTILNGIYPAALLSSFKPLNVFRGKSVLKLNDGFIRKGLVVFQFSLSVLLIISATVIYRQLSYVQNSNPGYKISQVISIQVPFKSFASLNDAARNNLFASLKRDMHSQSSIESVSTANSEIENVTGSSSGNADWQGRDTTYNPTIARLSVDQDFYKMFDLHLQKGRWFQKSNGDTHNYILNETAENEFHMHEPIVGQQFIWGGDTGNVIGVVKDFHYKSMHEKIGPMVLTYNGGGDSHIFIKTVPGNIQKAIKTSNMVWAKYIPDAPFTYTFLDDNFNALYKSDIKGSHLIFIFSMIAVIISALGLFGLAAFTAEQKTKEIGIRKVLGASVLQVVMLLSKGFLKLVVAATIIAFPIAWWVMNKWLQDFAYRITITWWFFVVAGSGALLIALITISFQSIKAAIANPVKSLRSE